MKLILIKQKHKLTINTNNNKEKTKILKKNPSPPQKLIDKFIYTYIYIHTYIYGKPQNNKKHKQIIILSKKNQTRFKI